MKITNKTRVFVSGGAGVIGTSLVNKLIEKGCEILVGDLKDMPEHWSDKTLYRKGDLNTLTKDEILGFQPEVIFHLAATFERSTESYEFWSENFHHNVSLSYHLMTLLKEIDSVKKIIFASSYLVYDPKLYLSNTKKSVACKLKESDPVLSRNLVGAAKLYHEMELRFLSQFFREKIGIVSARIFRGYGCGSRDVISRWIRSLLRKEAIEVFREENTFDFIFAEDSAEGLVRLAESDKASGVVNLGTGKSRSISEVLAVLKQYFPDMQIISVDTQIPFEASEADMSLFYDYTGWLPTHSIEEGILKIIDYEGRNLKED